MDPSEVPVSAKMKSVKYDDPRVAINRVYTRGGDKGETGLAGGQRIAKDSQRIEAYGTVDELNAVIGVARDTAEELIAKHPAMAELDAILKRVQHELFNVGSILATLPQDVHPRQARVTEAAQRITRNVLDRMLRTETVPHRKETDWGPSPIVLLASVVAMAFVVRAWFWRRMRNQ